MAKNCATCASGYESPKDSLVSDFGVSKDSFAYSEYIHYILCAVACHILNIVYLIIQKMVDKSESNFWLSISVSELIPVYACTVLYILIYNIQICTRNYDL